MASFASLYSKHAAQLPLPTSCRYHSRKRKRRSSDDSRGFYRPSSPPNSSLSGDIEKYYREMRNIRKPAIEFWKDEGRVRTQALNTLGRLFELQEAIQELQIENTQLQGKIQNLTEALSELQVFVWNQSQGSESAAEHLHHEHLQCHPNAHWRNTTVPIVSAPSVTWLLALMSLMATLTKS
ncbi:UNVERIFIED_CONTAM: hypothetical protein K2H54_037764 [Gekko kuhli]